MSISANNCRLGQTRTREAIGVHVTTRRVRPDRTSQGFVLELVSETLGMIERPDRMRGRGTCSEVPRRVAGWRAIDRLRCYRRLDGESCGRIARRIVLAECDTYTERQLGLPARSLSATDDAQPIHEWQSHRTLIWSRMCRLPAHFQYHREFSRFGLLHDKSKPLVESNESGARRCGGVIALGCRFQADLRRIAICEFIKRPHDGCADTAYGSAR